MKIDQVSIAWAAGLYEGEGTSWCSTSIQNKKTYVAFGLSIDQKDPEPLEKFLSIFPGGRLRPRPGRDIWILQYSKFEYAQFAAVAMMPYLSSRRVGQLRANLEKKVDSLDLAVLMSDGSRDAYGRFVKKNV